MKKRVSRVGNIILISICIGVSFGCSSDQGEERSVTTQSSSQLEQETEEETAEEGKTAVKGSDDQAEPKQEGETDLSGQEEYSSGEQIIKNVKKFFEETEEQGIDQQEAEEYLQTLMDDNIFQDGAMALTGIQIDDIDGNGQADMLVMVLDAQETPAYGSGSLWFYMNEDEPYCFSEEDCSYNGWFEAFWADIDNDENVEIVFSAQGTGCGAVGDSYKAVFKYKDHGIERMQLPSDFEEDYDCGIWVDVIQEPQKDSYSAYCPCFDERISFQAENVEGWDLPEAAQDVGSNARGYFNLRVAEYQGKKALQASEYLYGEGGVAHYVATAQFLIAWKADGTPEVVKWWIEEDSNTYANSRESRIGYSDGYFYYASQSDHDYLYRAREDGSEPQCLAKVQAAEICVRDDEIYFVSQSDGNGIYRIRTDGSGMKRLCKTGHDVQISAEYVYFLDRYEAKYDVAGLVTEKSSVSGDNYLYRMKKDSSARELIAKDVQRYVLNDGYCQEVYYIGSIYYTRYEYIGDGDEVELSFCRMEMDGQEEEELFNFRSGVDKGETKEDLSLAATRLMVYGGKAYCVWQNWEGSEAIIFWYDPGSETTHRISVPPYTDSCIYKGYFYGLYEQTEAGQKHQVKIFRVDLDGGDSEDIYEYTFEEKSPEEMASDIYATEEGVFFRRFVPEQEGWKWFRINEDKTVLEWKESKNRMEY